MTRAVEIDGKTVTLRTSALVPRMYRHLIGRDIVSDMQQLRTAFRRAQSAKDSGASDDDQNAAALSVLDLEIFENVAWVMLKHGAEMQDGVLKNGEMLVGRSPDEWLENLDGMFSVYEVLPIILELWDANQKTTSVPAKK